MPKPSWQLNFWYNTREDWEAGNARCADLRKYDNRARLSAVYDVPLKAAYDATEDSCDVTEVDDNLPYSCVGVKESVAHDLIAKINLLEGK